MTLHPIQALEQTIKGYESYLTTEFQARDPQLRQALEEALKRPRFLAQEPYFSAHRPFVAGKAWKDLPLDGRLAKALADRASSPNSYQHQEQAINHLLGQQVPPLVVSTGTGSGKSECFIAPVIQATLDDAIKTHKKAGMVALILYPMNALANDQLERIESYLKASGWDGTISVKMYNRSTSAQERAAMRENPPHILLTNYQMLEYLLVRPADRDALFKGHRMRYLVLDEVHTYRGTLGAHVALLLRRLKAHLKKAVPNATEPVPVGTSATIKSGEGSGGIAERDRAVQEFFSRLVGISDPASIKVVGEAREEVVIPSNTSVCLTPPQFPASFDLTTSTNQLTAALALIGLNGSSLSLVEVANRSRLLWLLNQWLAAQPMSLSALVTKSRQEINEWANWPQEEIERVVTFALQLGASLPENCETRLRLRAHRLVRGGWIFHRCIDPSCGKLYPRGETRCECGNPTAPLLLCRSCGADFLEMRGTVEGEGKLEPALSRVPGQTAPENSDSDETIKRWWLFRPDRWVWQDDEAGETEPGLDEDDSEDDAEELPTFQRKSRNGKSKGATSATKTRLLEGNYDLDQRLFVAHTGGKDKLIDYRKVCPGCQGRAGIFDVITPVTLGTSRAVKVLAEELLEALPPNPEDPKKRLLVFADSRQDAAHQAGFISYTARFDRMRMRVVSILTEIASEGPISFQTLVEKLGDIAVQRKDNPCLPGGIPRGEDLKKVRSFEEAPLLEDFALNRRFRASLERLGLVEVSYEGISDVVKEMLPQAHFLGLEEDPGQLTFLISRLLDLFRQDGALHRDMLQYHGGYQNYPEYLSAAGWSRRFSRVTGLPVTGDGKVALRLEGDTPQGVWARPLWHADKGAKPAPEKLLLHLAEQFGSGKILSGHLEEAGFEELMQSLEYNGLLKRAKLYGYSAQPTQLYQLNDAIVYVALATEEHRSHCNKCGTVVCGEGVQGKPCPRCSGILIRFKDEEMLANHYAYRASKPDAVALVAKEHTAQVTTEARKQIEDEFKDKNYATNLLACSPTLEMGIDVGGLDSVLLRNVPPRPDNYAQRGGRAGRRSRVGVVLGYTRNTPHDQYFFEHAEEMIAGEVPAPVFSLGNKDIVRRHIQAIAFGLAEPGLNSRMGEYIQFDGVLRQDKIDELKQGLESVHNQTLELANLAFGNDVLALAEYDASTLESMLSDLPGKVQEAFDRTATQVQRLRSAMESSYLTGIGQMDYNRAANLINKLLGNRDTRARNSSGKEDDTSAAYPLRRLAEFGLLPGYEFPVEPASVRLLSDRDEEQPVTASRVTGLRQYQPGAPVYARGRKWQVFGVDLSSPWNPQGQEASSLGYLRCSNCNLIRKESLPSCPRCRLSQSAKEQTAMAYAGFVAKPDDRMIATEEERISAMDTIELHPSWEAEKIGGSWQISDSDGWRLEWRQGETVYWLNEGKKRPDGTRSFFPLCSECGKLVQALEASVPISGGGKAKSNKAPAKGGKTDNLGHSEKCSKAGQAVIPVALYTDGKVETLRLILPWPTSRTDQHSLLELESWGWSLGYVLLAGAEKYFALAGGDLDVVFEGIRKEQKPGSLEPRTEVVLTIIDPNVGGSGYLKKLAVELPHVAAAALKHLDHEDCEEACYRCLKSYNNQRHHDKLRWQVVTGTLEGLAASIVQELPQKEAFNDDSAAWQEAFAAGCGSPLELKALRMLERLGLRPVKQYGINDPKTNRPFTIPDFAFVEEMVAIYIDGAAYHVGDRLRRDKAIDQRLTKAGWKVRRFTAREIFRGSFADEVQSLVGTLSPS